MTSGSRSELTRRALVSTGLAASAVTLMQSAHAQSATPVATGPHADVVNLSIAEANERMAAGTLTSVDLTTMYLERIAALDADGPKVNSVLETNPDALDIAAALDAERAAGTVRGPLHGVPILLKDNVDTADGMHTTAGSLALMNSTPPRDATIVKQLRDAGAVILGKVNLSEWANMRGFQSSSGWSGRGGFTGNPHSVVRNPSGSSSGSAAAVASDFCSVAIGTETNGSIVCPASVCGVVGLKPTVGLTSRAGVIPISHTQDSVGILGRTVADVAVTLTAMTGVDERDAATAASEPVVGTDYVAALDANALLGVRLGVPTNFGFTGYSNKADAVFAGALESLASLGAEIVVGTDVPTADELNASPGAFDRMVFEFKRDLNAYLAERGDPEFPDLASLIAFNNEHADIELRYFGQNVFELAEATSDDAADAMDELNTQLNTLSREKGIDAMLAEHQLDALVAVTMPPSSVTDPANGEKFMGASSNLAAIAGYPMITVPAGYAHGLPVGLSIIGTAWSEATLLSIAYAFEQATQMYRSPVFATTDIARDPAVPALELPPVADVPVGTPAATPVSD